MKQVSLRDFQRKATEYFKELPIELTVYGKVVAVVKTVDTNETVDTIIPPHEKQHIEKAAESLGVEEVRPRSTVVAISKEQQTGKKTRIEKAKAAIAHIQPKKIETPVLDWDKPGALPQKCDGCNRLEPGAIRTLYTYADGSDAPEMVLCPDCMKRLRATQKKQGGTIKNLDTGENI